MAALWFDDLDALQAARRTPEWRISTEDEANFVDETRMALFLTQEHEITGARRQDGKVVISGIARPTP
jgi:EthD domain